MQEFFDKSRWQIEHVRKALFQIDFARTTYFFAHIFIQEIPPSWRFRGYKYPSEFQKAIFIRESSSLKDDFRAGRYRTLAFNRKTVHFIGSN